MSELCKRLPIAIVEQYRRGAYARYAINSMKDIELRGAARVKTIINKGGRCNASRSDVTRMATLSKTEVNSNYVVDFRNDAYNMEADIHDFHNFCVFLVYKITALKKLSIEELFSYPIKRHFLYMDVLVPMIRLILERGGKQIHVKRIDSMLYV